MERCNKCILPKSIENLNIDQSGYCIYCRQFKKNEEKGEQDLIKVIKQAKDIKDRNKKYDAIVPISGGRDSTYVLYYAVKHLKLKVLAVSFDNDFVNEQAKENIKNASKILGNDFFIVKSKFKLPYLITKNLIKANISLGPYGIINNMCSACAFGQKAAIYKEAIKRKIPLILWGNSSDEATVERLQKISEKYRKKYKDFYKNPFNKYFNWNLNLAKIFFLLFKLELYVPGNSVFDKFFKMKSKDIFEISIFDYIKWDRKKIKETIMNELGWKKEKGHVSTWRNDCKIHPLMNWAFYKMYGCTKDAFGYSNMINTGQMDRETALKQELEMIKDIEKNSDFILSKIISLNEKEIKKIKDS